MLSTFVRQLGNSAARRSARHLAVAVISGIGLAAAPAAAAPVKALYVFGDSIVDSGNAHLAALKTGAQDPTPASAGYFSGRFSNGPTYVDLINQSLTGNYLTPSLAGGTNFAFGGARAVANADPLPDLAAQVDAYVQTTKGKADNQGVYIINVGANDLVALFQGENGSDPSAALAQVAGTIASQVDRLDNMGARRILVTGALDVGMVPAANGSPAENPEIGRATALALNAALSQALSALTLRSQVMTFDYVGFFDGAAGLGLETETSCLDAGGPSATFNCAGYAFFDGTHPTMTVHAGLAAQISQLIAGYGPNGRPFAGVRGDRLTLPEGFSIGWFGPADAEATDVPEPAAAGLIGFGVLALAARRRSG